MKNIVLIKDNKEVKQFRIREAFMVDGFRVLVDDYRYNKKDSAIVAENGKDDKVFKTENEALNHIIKTANKFLSVNQIDSYIVKEV